MLVEDAVAATVGAVSSPSAPPPGWYPDPTGSGRQRFFDGADWTEEVRAAPDRLARRRAPAPPVTAGPAAAPTPAPALVPAVSSPAAVRRPFSAPAQLARRGGAVSAQSAQALLVGAAPLAAPRPAPIAVRETAPAGWYPDPARGGGLRFFDSVKWTARTRPLPRQRGRRMPVPTALVAARMLAVADAAAVRRANDPLPVERIRVSRPAPTPSLSRQRTRSGSLLGMVATLTMLLGIASAGYFSWTLWGSDYYTAWKQQQLLAQLHAQAPVSAPPASGPAATVPAQATIPPIPPMPADHSGAVGEIKIPKIGLDMAFVAGTDEEDLKQGPGLWLPGAFPGTPGNTTISAHRTTYAHAFRHLDELHPGDRIYLDVPGQPEAVYEVRGSTIASPFAVQVTRQVPGVRLTMTTCNPVGSARQRLVVEAELVSGAWASQAVPASSWQLLK